MQYSLPPYRDRFVGDPMPWWDGETFHLFYLLDEGHHSANNGLGGHQWAHSSTKNLVHWEHHPLAIPLGSADEFDWTSICTGSLFAREGTTYAYYATRVLQPGGAVHEAVGLSTSEDSVHFTKHQGNPILWPSEPYRNGGFRDPCVFEYDGRFHMLVTGELAGDRNELQRHCMAHYVSSDLLHWEPREPLLVPGSFSAVECPDWFEWNGWYYITWLEHGLMTYRMSRGPFGPWQRPAVDTFDGDMLAAAKSAPFGPDRRLAVGFLRWRDGDGGPVSYAGNAIFRELVQQSDGTLSAVFPQELIPRTESPHARSSERLDVAEGIAIRALGNCVEGRVSCTVEPEPDTREFGLLLRAGEASDHGYELHFRPEERTVSLSTLHRGATTALHGVEFLKDAVVVDIIMISDIIDVSISPAGGTRGAHCLVTRYPEWEHTGLMAFARDGGARFRELSISPLSST